MTSKYQVLKQGKDILSKIHLIHSNKGKKTSLKCVNGDFLFSIVYTQFVQACKMKALIHSDEKQR